MTNLIKLQQVENVAPSLMYLMMTSTTKGVNAMLNDGRIVVKKDGDHNYKVEHGSTELYKNKQDENQ